MLLYSGIAAAVILLGPILEAFWLLAEGRLLAGGSLGAFWIAGVASLAFDAAKGRLGWISKSSLVLWALLTIVLMVAFW